MLKKKLFQESIDEYFRKQPLDESQRDDLRKCLQSSRYSRLKYSRTADQILDECLLIDDAQIDSVSSKSSLFGGDKSTSDDVQRQHSGNNIDDLNRAFEMLESSSIRDLEKKLTTVDSG